MTPSPPDTDAEASAGAGGLAGSLPPASPPPAFESSHIDSSNPYAPTSTMAPSPPSGDFAPRQISFDEVFSKTWTIFKEQWLMVCVAVLIVSAINTAINFAEQAVQMVFAAGDMQEAAVASAVVLGLVRAVIQTWLQIGTVLVMLDVARGKEVNLVRLFGGTPYLLQTIVASIVMMLIISAMITGLVGIPAGIGFLVTGTANGAGSGALIGGLIAIVPVVIVALMLCQFQTLIVDRGAGPIEALQLSRQITNGNKLTLFVIFIAMFGLFFVCMIVGLLALCVGVIPAMIGYSGYVSLLMVVTYLSMTNQPVVTQRTFVQPAPNFS